MNSVNKGATFKVGTKDNKVYFEIWSKDDVTRIVDGDLTPDQAYGIGESLIAHALKQGYKPEISSPNQE